MNKTLFCLAFVLLIGQLTAQAHLWRFDENEGCIAYDDTCDGRDAVDGKLVNAEWLDLSKVGAGAAVRLTGDDNSYVDFGTCVGQFCTEDFTVAFWIQTTDYSRISDLVGNRQAVGHGSFFSVRLTADGHITAEVDGDCRDPRDDSRDHRDPRDSRDSRDSRNPRDPRGDNYILVKSKQCDLNDGNWHQVVVTRCGNTLSLYIDGELSDTGCSQGVADINNGNPFRLGRSLVDRNTACFSPDAVFDDLSIYNIALQACDVKELYCSATNQ